MSNGPLPSTLTFLSSLPTTPIGSKVRFLGCVTQYALSSAILSLEHDYPCSHASTTVALVDVNLLLESLKREDTQVGAWVNVIGYVEGVVGDGRVVELGEGNGLSTGGARIVEVKVKAVMLWSAGGVRIGEYEKALEERLSVSRKRKE